MDYVVRNQLVTKLNTFTKLLLVVFQSHHVATPDYTVVRVVKWFIYLIIYQLRSEYGICNVVNIVVSTRSTTLVKLLIQIAGLLLATSYAAVP
jgi:hypothetical protein